jgi:hypothetical protein
MAALALARSRIGHAAGVMNYACLGFVAARMAWPTLGPPALVPSAALVTVAVNMGAVLVRALGRRGRARRRASAQGEAPVSRPARARRGGERTRRSRR